MSSTEDSRYGTSGKGGDAGGGGAGAGTGGGSGGADGGVRDRRSGARAERPAGHERRGAGRPRSANGPAPGRPPGRATYRRALRREAPTVVGMLLHGRDFTTMTGYPSFVFEDYDRYLHHLDELLRDLHDRGTHVAVTHFDPAAYADYCDSTRQPPDAPLTRTRYVAEAAVTGASVRYARQPMSRLRAELAREAERRATWERASDLLIAAGPCPECGDDLAHCAFDQASHSLFRLIEALGPGRHHAVCSLSPDDGGPTLLAALLIEATDQDDDGDPRLSEPDALVLCTVLAASTVTARPAGLVIRTSAPHDPAKTTATARTRADTETETVRGWTLHRGQLRPLSEAEVFSAYCTDPATGDPLPPEPGVRYRAGIPLPPPPPGDTR